MVLLVLIAAIVQGYYQVKEIVWGEAALLVSCILVSLVCFILSVYWNFKEAPVIPDNRNDTEQDLPAVVELPIIEDEQKKRRRKFQRRTMAKEIFQLEEESASQAGNLQSGVITIEA